MEKILLPLPPLPLFLYTTMYLNSKKYEVNSEFSLLSEQKMTTSFLIISRCIFCCFKSHKMEKNEIDCLTKGTDVEKTVLSKTVLVSKNLKFHRSPQK